jgi:hypothetical protein
MKTPPHNPDRIVATDGFENATWTNGDRTKSASDAIHHYGLKRGMDEDTETLSVDLITDVLHLLHSKGIDVDLVLRLSKRHFEAEAGEPLFAA